MNEVLDLLFQTKADVAFLAVAAVCLPFVIGLINQATWTPLVKTLVSVAACAVAAAGWIVTHEFSTNRYVVYAVVLLGATQLFYYAMKPGVKQFEDKTSL